MGLCLLYDLYARALNLKAHYTDAGVLPLETWMKLAEKRSLFSFHALVPDTTGQLVLFSIAAVFALLFTIGYKTKIFHLLSLIFLLSLQSRNPLVSYGVDNILRVVLFWALFLPLGGRFSLDQKLKPRRGPTHVANIFSFAFIFQIFMIYFFSALQKMHPIWYLEHSAVYYALNMEQITSWIGNQLRHFTSFLKVITVCVFSLELLGSFFFFSKIDNFKLRTVAVYCFLFFHLGIAVMLTLGHFPYACMVVLIALLPSSFFERFRIFREDPVGTGDLPAVAKSFWRHSFCVLIVYTLIFNISKLRREWALPTAFYIPSQWIGLNQNWALFAPFPNEISGWFFVDGALKDGRHLDVFNPHLEPVGNRPKLVSDAFKDHRWAKYLLMLPGDKKTRRNRRLFSQYLCRDWNSRHSGDTELQSLILYHIAKNNRKPPHIYSTFKLYEHDCRPNQPSLESTTN